jgi:hypothetical protein
VKLEQPEQLVIQEPQVPKEYRVSKVQLVLPETLVPKVIKETRVILVPLVRKETKVKPELKVFKGSKVKLGPQE